MKLKEHFKACIEQIDFEKIESVMRHLDWKWYMLEWSTRVPNKSEMINTCKTLFKKAKEWYKKYWKQYFVSTWWFTVSVDKWYVKIDFSLEEWVSYDEENDNEENYSIVDSSDYNCNCHTSDSCYCS